MDVVMNCLTKHIMLMLCAHAYSVQSEVVHAKQVSVRLRGSSLAYAGRVEIRRGEEEWGTICDAGWDKIDARVVCSQLGFKDVEAAISGAAFDPGSGPIWMRNVHCHGNESSISQCTFQDANVTSSDYCNHERDAGILCTPNQGMRLEMLIFVLGVAFIFIASFIALTITIHHAYCRRSRHRRKHQLMKGPDNNANVDQERGHANENYNPDAESPTVLSNSEGKDGAGAEDTSQQQNGDEISRLEETNEQPAVNKGYMKLKRRSLAYFYMKLTRGSRKRDSQIVFLDAEEHKYYAIKNRQSGVMEVCYEQIDINNEEKENQRQSTDSDCYVQVRGETGGDGPTSPNEEEYLEILPSDDVRDSMSYEYIFPKDDKNETQDAANTAHEEPDTKRDFSSQSSVFTDEEADTEEENLKDSSEVTEATDPPEYVELFASDNEIKLKEQEAIEKNGQRKISDIVSNEPDYMTPNLPSAEKLGNNAGYHRDLPPSPDDNTVCYLAKNGQSMKTSEISEIVSNEPDYMIPNLSSVETGNNAGYHRDLPPSPEALLPSHSNVNPVENEYAKVIPRSDCMIPNVPSLETGNNAEYHRDLPSRPDDNTVSPSQSNVNPVEDEYAKVIPRSDCMIPNVPSVETGNNAEYHRDLPSRPDDNTVSPSQSNVNPVEDEYAKVIPRSERKHKDDAGKVASGIASKPPKVPPTKPKPIKHDATTKGSELAMGERVERKDKEDLASSDHSSLYPARMIPSTKQISPEIKRKAVTAPTQEQEQQSFHPPSSHGHNRGAIENGKPSPKPRRKNRSETFPIDGCQGCQTPREMEPSFLLSLKMVLENKNRGQHQEDQGATGESSLRKEQKKEPLCGRDIDNCTERDTTADSVQEQVHTNSSNMPETDENEHNDSAIYENVDSSW